MSIDTMSEYEKFWKDMEEELQIILKNYIEKVEQVCNILLKSINRAENLSLRNKYDFFTYRAKCRKMEFEAEGISYRMHGIGCAAFRGEEMLIDWDFGYRSRWCGIDPWKVSMTLKYNNSSYKQYYDWNLVKAGCEEAVRKGIMFKKCDRYYFEIRKEETFQPDFPAEYDTLFIEHFNAGWPVPRNKVTDRFIRKSVWVHNRIDESKDQYILRFLSDGREVFTIAYDDVSYPESSVRIMSDEIIKNLRSDNAVTDNGHLA